MIFRNRHSVFFVSVDLEEHVIRNKQKNQVVQASDPGLPGEPRDW